MISRRFLSARTSRRLPNQSNACHIPEGCAIPIILSQPLVQSQIASISVRKGGGQCVGQPPAPPAIGSLEWRKTVATGIDPPPPADSFTGDFKTVGLPSFISPIPSRYTPLHSPDQIAIAMTYLRRLSGNVRRSGTSPLMRVD